ncbi:MAG TPA: hypothetical protein VK158_01690 [Acidobacteriota bacterium]|nr:hypothetical protein [Acidobacteriota bacterium]
MELESFKAVVVHSYARELPYLRTGSYQFNYVNKDVVTGHATVRVWSEGFMDVTELFPMMYVGTVRKTRYGTFCLYASLLMLQKLARVNDDKPYIEFQFPNEKSKGLMPKIGMKNGFASPLDKVIENSRRFLLESGYSQTTLENVVNYVFTDAELPSSRQLHKSLRAK